VDAASGEEVWTFDAGMPIWSSPAVAKGVVFVGGGGLEWGRGALFAIDADGGDEVWRFEVNDGAVVTSPAVSNGLVYATSSSLYAIDAKSGEEVWTHADEKASFDTAPAVVDDVVYVGGSKLVALDADTGETVWTFTDAGAYVAIPVVADGVIYAGTYHAELLAIDAESGKERWRFRVEIKGSAGDRQIESSPAVIDGVIYFGSFVTEADQASGMVHAIGVTR
jgi:outer membrane protein assembly factor BamB